MDLRSWDSNTEEIQIDKKKKKKKTVFTDEQIVEVKRIYTNWQSNDTSLYKDIPELCKSVPLDGENGIKQMNYSLAPSKYIEFVNQDAKIDVTPMMKKLAGEIKHALEVEKETVRLLEMASEEV